MGLRDSVVAFLAPTTIAPSPTPNESSRLVGGLSACSHHLGTLNRHHGTLNRHHGTLNHHQRVFVTRCWIICLLPPPPPRPPQRPPTSLHDSLVAYLPAPTTMAPSTTTNESS